MSHDQASSTVKHVHMQHALQPTNPRFSHPRKVVLTARRIQKLRIGNRDRLDAARIDLPDAAGLLASSPFMRSLRRCRSAFRRPRRLSSSFASSAVSFRLIRPLLMNSAQSTGAIIFVRKSANCRYVGTHRINTTLFSTKLANEEIQERLTLCRDLACSHQMIKKALCVSDHTSRNFQMLTPCRGNLLNSSEQHLYDKSKVEMSVSRSTK